MADSLEKVFVTGSTIEMDVAKSILEDGGLSPFVLDQSVSPYPVSAVTTLSDSCLLVNPEHAEFARNLLDEAVEDGVLARGKVVRT